MNTLYEGKASNLSIKARVLIVEDESAVRTLTRRILERAGCEVETSEDGLSGLKLFSEKQDELDLVLIDCTLPYMSGVELYQEIEKLRPRMPVIFCSGYDEENVLPHVNAMEYGSFLHKPYKANDLTSALVDLLNKDSVTLVQEVVSP